MKYHFSLPAVVFATVALLTACGGGGGGGDGPVTPPSTRFGSSALYENQCTLGGQKQFIRAYMDEVYRWYDEIPEINAAAYNNVPDYFNALLVRTPDANGQPKDRFSAVLPASQASALLSQQFRPDVLANHTNAVPVTKVVTSTGGRRVGYIQFNDHESGAQDDLIAAFRQLQGGQGIQDLVLDLRFNSGGFLYVAQTAASMITGPVNDGKVFEQLRYNDKRFAETNASTMLFGGSVQFAEPQNSTGTLLPRLALPRVYMLTSGQTCSSSESIINGLRGVDVQVVLVGDTTCGKPFGFRQKNNCGWAFFPIEFQGYNAKGFGDYTTGFAPTCRVADNPSVPADNPVTDPLFRTALYHADNGACPPGTVGGLLSSGAPNVSRAQPSRPAWAGRLLGPER